MTTTTTTTTVAATLSSASPSAAVGSPAASSPFAASASSAPLVGSPSTAFSSPGAAAGPSAVAVLQTTSVVQSTQAQTGDSAAVAQLKQMLDEKESTITRLSQQVNEIRETALGKLKAYRDALEQQLREQAVHDRHTTMLMYLQNVQRLGWFSFERIGHQVTEVWRDGSAMLELNLQQRQLDERRRVLEEQKKRLLKLKPVKPRAKVDKKDEPFAMPPPVKDKGKLTEEEYYEQECVLGQNMETLSNDEKEHKQRLVDLKRECHLHSREARRIMDEEQARYKDLPYKLKERYLLLSLLGKGGFSEVYKAYDLQECRYVACKIHQLSPQWTDSKKMNYIKHATREYEIHKDLKHERVVELYDVLEIDSNSFSTVLEYCNDNDLDFLLKQQHTLTEKDARTKIIQIMSALKYLNESGKQIIHYDLKPANVLFMDGKVKVTDFGLAKLTEQNLETELTSQGAGTYWYLPPECFRFGQGVRISNKVDVWSVGVIFFQCLYGQRPFGHDQSQQAILQNQIILNAHEVKFPESKQPISDEAKSFIQACLTYDVNRRPDVLTLCNHPYLQPKRKKTPGSE
eukprot:m.165477 g.165477  ORF g.165477 m.165477 type:complete len:573 (+) comp17159_c1_seq1:1413-3131(+)